MPASPEIRTSFYLLIVPADGIGTADKELSGDFGTSPFFGQHYYAGRELNDKAQENCRRIMQDFREIVWSGIELLNITAQALRNGLVQRVGHEPPALIDHVHGDIARSR